jgi:methylmalonyl-CoA/ethylmalonyl-CoA epimerase
MRKKGLVLAVLSVLLFAAGYASPGAEEAASLLGGGRVTQIALVVRDVEKSAREYAAVLGVPVPSWELTDPVDKAHTLYMGRPSTARAKLAFIELPNIVIELIEPVGGPSTWMDFLVTKGEGVHHIAFEVKDMDKRLAELKAKGVPLVQSGDYTGGRYAYVDATARLGIFLELLENF